jgi:alanyl-tRNA synthetase
MNQFKDVFLGNEKRDYTRAVSSQKCIRAGGKHNDLDEVGPDDEARDLWIKAGAQPDRVLGFGRKDNFWQMGDTGPCGPCSEIHYYMGEDPSDPEKNSPYWVNGPGDTTMEIWNLVFMQYNRTQNDDGSFTLTPLPAPSVDTGMGLERMTTVMQHVKTNYETDLLKPIVEFTAGLAT